MKKYIWMIILVVIFVSIPANAEPRDSISLAPITGKTIPTYLESNLNTNALGIHAYGFESFPYHRLLYFFDLANSSAAETKFNYDLNGDFFCAGDFLGKDYTNMYALSFMSEDLWKINLSTSVATWIGHPAKASDIDGWTGMTITQDGIAYITSTDYFRTALYILDLTTGQSTLIGTTEDAPVVIDIAAVGDKIYALDIHYDALFTIDPQTAQATLVGSIGYETAYAQDMDYDEQSGVLYLVTVERECDTDGWCSIQGQLRSADLETGMTTFIDILPGGGEVEAFGIIQLQYQYLPIVNQLLVLN